MRPSLWPPCFPFREEDRDEPSSELLRSLRRSTALYGLGLAGSSVLAERGGSGGSRDRPGSWMRRIACPRCSFPPERLKNLPNPPILLSFTTPLAKRKQSRAKPNYEQSSDIGGRSGPIILRPPIILRSSSDRQKRGKSSRVMSMERRTPHDTGIKREEG